MSCVVPHSPVAFPVVDHARAEFHGLMLPRSARGEIHDHTIESRHLSGDRRIRVFVPSREFMKQDLPIVIVHDGHKAFEPARERAEGVPPWEQRGTLQLHRVMDGLSCEDRIQPAIVVGLIPRASSRINEALPHRHTIEGVEVGGQGEANLRFLEHELLPFVRHAYGHVPLARGPQGHVLVGTSVGGFSSIYAALKRPDLFGGVVAASPSAWIGDGELARLVRETGHVNVRCALDIGESEAPNNIQHCCTLFQAFKDSGWTHGTNLLTRLGAGEHNEDSWRARIPGLLEFVIPGQRSAYRG